MKQIASILFIIFFSSCSSVSQFGAGVDITFDPRTIGMQIDRYNHAKKFVSKASFNR